MRNTRAALLVLSSFVTTSHLFAQSEIVSTEDDFASRVYSPYADERTEPLFPGLPTKPRHSDYSSDEMRTPLRRL